MKNENLNQINLAYLFLYNTDYGLKEGREAEKIFYYYPPEENIQVQIRSVGFCAGMVRFTETFKASKSCEFVHTEKTRIILHHIEETNFWMVMGLKVPLINEKYDNNQISDSIYMSVLKQAYNYYKVFNGNLNEALEKLGPDNLKTNLKAFFDDVILLKVFQLKQQLNTYVQLKYIEKKLNVQNCDIMNTFNGIHFMSLDRNIYLKIQCLLNLLEEKVPLVNKTVVMHADQVIWSGLEQDDIASIYGYLKEIVIKNLNLQSTQAQPGHVAKFLLDNSTRTKKTQTSENPTTSIRSSNQEPFDESYDYELNRVYLGNPLEQFYLIPYNLSKLTFFIFIPVNESFKLSLLYEIDAMLGSSMVVFLQEIADLQLKHSLNSQDERDVKYIYFNRLNLAQKSTLNTKEIPKYIFNLISQLSKDLERCAPSSEIFVKSGRDYWLACKKSDLREVYVVVCQKNANLTLIDEEVKQLCLTNFSNIFFME